MDNEAKKEKATLLDPNVPVQVIGLENIAIIPVCCREGWKSCPHVLKREGLPTKLKNPKCFDVVEEKLRVVMKSEHTHKSVREFVRCDECMARRKKRTDLMKELGFKSINQFMEWRKIMTIIKNKSNFQVR